MADSANNIYDVINKALDSTAWFEMKPGLAKQIKMGEVTSSVVYSVMSHYKSVGWIVRAKFEIQTTKKMCTLEFINPYHV